MTKPPRAQVLFKDSLHYRREAFRHGMQVAGFSTHDHVSDPRPGDVLVIWNRSLRNADEALRFERAGARVVVAENGYLGKGWRGGNWYALALDHHAGAGTWPNPGPERWDGWGAPLAPFRTGGSEVIVLGQRGIGEVGLRSPDGWAESMVQRLGTGRVRKHPGRHQDSAVPLEADLQDAQCVVTWASSAALQALLLGVPVWYEMPRWIGAQAGRHVTLFGKEPPNTDERARLAMFRRLAWAMWHLDEIDDGTAFRYLLQRQEVCA